MLSRSWLAPLGFLGLVAVVSAAGGLVTASSVGSWYATLDKPAWTPPSWLFGPVWTALYVMMAVVAWRLWRRRDESAGARFTLRLWYGQLALNGAWSYLFFGLRSPGAGLVDIVALLVVLIWIQIRLVRVGPGLAVAWLPYVAWVGFATALNAAIWLR